MEIHEEAWSDEMRAQTQKFKRAGITLRSALGPIPIPGTTRTCDGVSHLGVESIVQSDSPFFSFEQLCDHEVGHVLLGESAQVVAVSRIVLPDALVQLALAQRHEGLSH